MNVAWQLPSGTTKNVISGEALEFPPGIYTEVDNARTWAGQHGLAGGDLDPAIDADGDGFTNQQEFDARTNPNDIDDLLQLWLGSDGSGLSFDAVSGKTYRVEYRNGLDDPAWQLLSEFVAGQPLVEVDDLSASNQTARFYRLLVNP